MEDVTVTVASDAEARACLALLPEVRGGTVELLIARRRGELAGAAAVFWRSWRRPSGFPLTLRVVPDARRRGVGRRLLAAAAGLAEAETDGLWSYEAVAEESEAARFMAAYGFTAHHRELHFQGTVEALLHDIAPLAARLRGRGGAASRARIVPLSLAPLEEIGWLVSAELGGGPARALARLRRRTVTDAESRDRSHVVMIDDSVAGAMLWGVAPDGVAAVEARVVAPGWRGGPINLVLLEAGLLRCQAEGVTRMRFHCDDTVRDTISLARRAAAQEIAARTSYYYEFADDRPSGASLA
jgi:GNAT superfamily N-acetyltransferase